MSGMRPLPLERLGLIRKLFRRFLLLVSMVNLPMYHCDFSRTFATIGITDFEHYCISSDTIILVLNFAQAGIDSETIQTVSVASLDGEFADVFATEEVVKALSNNLLSGKYIGKFTIETSNRNRLNSFRINPSLSKVGKAGIDSETIQTVSVASLDGEFADVFATEEVVKLSY
jgi:hypothetical protein